MLFLVRGNIDISSYPDGRSREEVLRLVVADTTEAAEAKFTHALTVSDPFGTSRTPSITEISAAIE